MTTNDTLLFWTRLLHLQGFDVAHVQQDNPTQPLRLTLIPNTAVGLCPQCQHACDTIHRRYPSDAVTDLPLGAQAVELTIRTYQFACSHCGHFFTPPSPGFVRGAHATERFLEQAARLIRFSDIANAAAFLGVAEKTLEKWYYDYVERQQQTPNVPLQPIQQLGIDELALKKKSASS
jgi:transposase